MKIFPENKEKRNEITANPVRKPKPPKRFGRKKPEVRIDLRKIDWREDL